MEQREAYLLLLVLFFVTQSAKSNQVIINVAENRVECTYIGFTNGHYSTLYILVKDADQTCDVIANDRCREQLINSTILQITDDYPCEHVANTNTVLCLLDMDQVCEACCRLDDDEDCYPDSN